MQSRNLMLYYWNVCNSTEVKKTKNRKVDVHCVSMSMGLTFLMLDNNVPDAAPGAGIHSCGWFIQNHQTGPSYEGDGDWQLALHAPRQRAHPFVSVSIHPRLLQDPGRKSQWKAFSLEFMGIHLFPVLRPDLWVVVILLPLATQQGVCRTTGEVQLLAFRSWLILAPLYLLGYWNPPESVMMQHCFRCKGMKNEFPLNVSKRRQNN